MKTYTFLCTLAATMLFSTSCQDLLKEQPDSYYEKENFFQAVSNAEMAVTGIYDVMAKLDHYGQYEMAMPCSDDTYFIDGTGSDNTRRDIAHYTISSSNDWIESVWQYKYQGIDRANYAIQGIEQMPEYAANDSRVIPLVAQARFLRAFFAFDLVRYFGDVPFKTTYTANHEDAFQPRSNREVIYDQIIADLDYAKNNLPWGSSGSSPERATQGAARALLMRVYLQRAGYSLQLDGRTTRPADDKRKAYFEAVINEWQAFQANGYHTFDAEGYQALFKRFSFGSLNSTESLFEIAFYTPDGSREDAGNWGTYNGPKVAEPDKSADKSAVMGRANAFFRAVPEWRGFFEPTDARRDVMICTYQYEWKNGKHVKKENAMDVTKEQWYPGKWRREWMPIGYKEPNNTDVNYCVLRYADVVLMAAEAYNELGSTTQAWALLNSVRSRSGATPITMANYASLLKAPRVYNLPYIDDTDEKGKFRTALYWERGFELAFEGQRKYDLIRWNVLADALTLFGENIAPKLKKANIYPAYLNFTKGKHELFPIPLDEIQLNKKLEGIQNPGY
ncbi:RagB/SusD family nutrient uptake outer membrane protein [Bacteroides neonati]|uniref:RagB/SusD family nutrient uptake outer membrane protein n=1 Tax=Bacteroides neonati TaxID=1347393 RepID=UPI0004AD3F49|nr:RagB/SusD family nutrient uptake outer membrane protein [Bacteroides neonati]